MKHTFEIKSKQQKMKTTTKWKKLYFKEKNSIIKILKKLYSAQSNNKLEISNLHTYKENVRGEY